MATTKTVNYTDVQTAEMVEAYKATPTVDTVKLFAEKFGKSTKSIVAKLSKEGVYVKKEYKTKQGEKPVDKEHFASFIGDALKLDEASTSSLAKANKKALEEIAKAFGFIA
jgi:hypothetical protein